MRGIFLGVALAAFANANSELTASGRAALARGDLDSAIVQLEKAVTADPDDFDAHSVLGEAYGRKAEKAGLLGGLSLAWKAKAEFERCVELNPDSVDARRRLIEFYIRAPRIAGGSEKKALAQAAEIRKRDVPGGHRAYALIYTLQKKPDLAAKEMAQAAAQP